MAQFDVHRLANRPGLVIDCQTDLLDHIETRFVVPLVSLADVTSPVRRLNPVFAIDGEDHAMLTQSAAAIRRRDLGPNVASLTEHHHEIIDALDFLLTGV